MKFSYLEAQDLNFKKSNTLFASSEGSAETAHLQGMSGPCLLAYAININLVSIAGAGFC